MALLPNKGKKILSETNFDAPGGLKVSACCDLDLYEELGNAARGVLVVTWIGSIKFKEGKATNGGGALTWTSTEKNDFISKFRSSVKSVWDERHRLKTASTIPALTDVGVTFDIQITEDLSAFSHSHWNITVIKVDQWRRSCVQTLLNTFITNGECELDSLDTTGASKGASVPQRGVVHEFGHTLGYRDEYAGSNGKAQDNPSWLSDVDSIMNGGETIRERHYAFLAHWLTTQYKVAASLSKEAIDWKVNGNTTLANARL